jgi:hypothetical protein
MWETLAAGDRRHFGPGPCGISNFVGLPNHTKAPTMTVALGILRLRRSRGVDASQHCCNRDGIDLAGDLRLDLNHTLAGGNPLSGWTVS